MCPFEIYRPKTIEEAVKYLEQGVPLAGGTALTPQRRNISAVIDLQRLGLDQLAVEDGFILAGAAVTLQMLFETEKPLPDFLRQACRLEAAWNIRNMATIGGTIVSGDGRSPLLTVLLALDAEVFLQPGDDILPVGEFLAQRFDPNFRRLMTMIRFPMPQALLYEQVSRTPADRPVVCAAVAYMHEENAKAYRVVLGGFGKQPVRVLKAEQNLGTDKDNDAVVKAVRNAYADAGDEWASSEYRSHAAGILVRRLLAEIMD